MSQATLAIEAPRPLDARATDAGAGRVVVDTTRPRQTEVAASPFREILAGGVSVLMGGAAVATHVMGAPALAAAISSAEGRAATSIASGQPVALRDRSLSAQASATPALPAATGSDSADLATMQAMQRESQVFNMQLLELQEEVQQENRRFTTLSNVLRAKHDTAKAAVSNIRS
jgi:hypothetical protein